MLLIKKWAALSAVACTCMHTALFGQSSIPSKEIVVSVYDATTGQSLPGSMVAGVLQQTTTNMDGFCSMRISCDDKAQKISISSLGYLERSISVSCTADTFRVALKAGGLALDAVEIHGHRQALSTANSVASIEGQQLDQLKGNNLANVLKDIPGVSMLQTGATISKPVINGMHSNRVLILNNGIRQEGQQWGSEHAPEIDPFIAKRMTVVKGAEGVRYGSDAIGGVVIVEPAALPQDSSVHAEVNLVGASNTRSGAASATLSGNLKKLPELSWRLQGTLKKSGNYKTADYFLTNTGATEANYSAAVGYNREHIGFEAFFSHFNSKLGVYQGSDIGSTEDLMAHINYGRPYSDGYFSYNIDVPRQEVVHDLLKLSGHVHLSDYWHLNLQYGFQRDQRREYDIRRGGRESLPSQNLDLYTHLLDGSVDFFDGRQWKLSLGTSLIYQDNENVPGTLTTPIIPDYVQAGAGVYGIGRLVKTDYELELGLRYDYKNIDALGYDKYGQLYGNDRTFNTFTGSFGFVWHPAAGLDMRSNLGTAWRPASVNELYSRGIHQSVGAYEIGDSSLNAEQSLKWITSLQYDNRAGWFSLNADVYAHFFNDYIYLQPTGEVYSSLSGIMPIFRQRQTDARFLGADLTARFRFLKNFDYTIKGSVVRAKDTRSNTFLPMIPADRVEQSLRWSPEGFAFFKKPEVQLGFEYVGKQTRYEQGSDFAPPPDAYYLMNLSVGSHFTLLQRDLFLNLAATNLTNVLYKDYMNRFRYYAHDIGRNFTLRLVYRI